MSEFNSSNLLVAVQNGDESLVIELLEHGISCERPDADGDTLIHLAAVGGHVGILALLAQHGASINTRNLSGQTPAMAAASSGNEESIQLLIKLGCEIEYQNSNGETALSYAIVWNQASIVALLLAAGGLPNGVGGEWTPLHYAAQEGNQEIVEKLLHAGASTKIVDSHMRTPQDIAKAKGHTHLVALLSTK